MTEDTKRTKERSPTFPFISLGRAVERAKQFYAEERRGTAPYSRVAGHWKYSESSSGAFQTVAALKSYGLLDEAGGSGAQRQLKLSELALRILLDQREDSSEKNAHLRQAALAPAISEEVYNKWPDGLPGDATLQHFLVLERKFSPEAATKAIRILRENEGYGRLDGGEVLSSEPLEEEELVQTTLDRTGLSPERQGAVAIRDSAASTRRSSPSRLVLEDQGVTIALEFSQPPTAEVWEYIAEFAQFQGKRAKRQGAAAGATTQLGITNDGSQPA